MKEHTSGYWERNSEDRGGAEGIPYAAVVALEDAREEARARERDRESLNPPYFKDGKILAWRNWRYDQDSGLLCGPMLMECLWYPDGPMKSHELPSAGWGNGFHAYKDRTRASSCSTIYIVGSVLLWGDIVEHQHGYRAEFAEVHSIDWVSSYAATGSMPLFFEFRGRQLRKRLRALYGVNSP